MESNKPKRPMNAYFAFRMQFLEKEKGLDKVEKEKKLKEAWTNIDPKLKQSLENQFQKENEQYHKLMDQWKIDHPDAMQSESRSRSKDPSQAKKSVNKKSVEKKAVVNKDKEKENKKKSASKSVEKTKIKKEKEEPKKEDKKPAKKSVSKK